MGLVDNSILSLPLHLQSLFLASNRIIVHSSFSCISRDNNDQHRSVWLGSYWPLANRYHQYPILDHGSPGCIIFRSYLPCTVRFNVRVRHLWAFSILTHFSWSTQTFTIAEMTPIWIFPAYPMLVIGPLAGAICGKLEPSRSLPTILVGLAIQGVGFLMSLMVYSAFIYRLMSHKLPKESIRPGMFVSVGPSGFTVAGIINMALEARRAFPTDFLGNGPVAASIFKVTVDLAALWLWG